MSRPSFRRQAGNESALRSVVALVGASALVLGVVAALVPGVGDVVASTVGVVVGSPVLVVLVALGGGAYGLLELYRTGSTEPEPNPLVRLAPERAHYDENAISGEDIDKSVEAVGGELPESSAKDWWTYREKNDVQSSLESVAVRVLASEHDVSTEAATRLVESGEWTDDPRASAFLGTDTPDLPLKLQFVDWLSGEAYQRRVAATVDAIARHAGVATPDAGDDDGRTATGSALPVHAAAESERLRAAAEELMPDADGSGDEDGATSMADVRLDDAVADGDTASGDDAASTSDESTPSTAPIPASSGEGDDADVEVATESGGETR